MISRHFARIALFSLLMAGAGLLAAQTAVPAKPPAGKTLPASAAATDSGRSSRIRNVFMGMLAGGSRATGRTIIRRAV